MTRVVGYCRVSTEEQGQGDSLDAQKASITRFCTLQDLEIIGWETDDTSASTLAREGLKRALATVDRGDASGLVAAKLARFTRSVADLEDLKKQGMGKRWRLWLVQENIDTETIMGAAFLQMLTVFAELERRETGKRTKDLLAYAKSQGQPLGAVPYGWRRIPVTRDALGRRVGERGRLVPDPETSEVVRMMAGWHGAGESLSGIARRLNEARIPGAMGGAWTATSVRRVLKASAPQLAAVG